MIFHRYGMVKNRYLMKYLLFFNSKGGFQKYWGLNIQVVVKIQGFWEQNYFSKSTEANASKFIWFCLFEMRNKRLEFKASMFCSFWGTIFFLKIFCFVFFKVRDLHSKKHDFSIDLSTFWIQQLNQLKYFAKSCKKDFL